MSADRKSPAAAGLLRVRRRAQYADVLRKYRLVVDGAEAGSLGRRSELEIPLPAGEHTVVARIDWCSSAPVRIRVREGATTELEVRSNVSGWRLLLALWYVVARRSRYLELRSAPAGR